MSSHRVFCQPSTLTAEELVLAPDESHHLVVVLRVREDDAVVAFDGMGNEWICQCKEVSRKAARLQVRFHQKVAPLPYSITLAQAIPKGKYMDSIVRKATEIGVARIVPLYSERTEVRLEQTREENRLGKWRAAAVEACKQCGNPWLPRVENPQAADQFITHESEKNDLRLIASLQPGAISLRAVLDQWTAETGHPPRQVLWLVGPEGDFTPAELGLARQAGFAGITLGPLVLRCETAAVYALSILSYELGLRWTHSAGADKLAGK